MIQKRFFTWSGMALSAALALGFGFTSVATAGSPGSCSTMKTSKVAATGDASSCPVMTKTEKVSTTHVTMSAANCPVVAGCDYSSCSPEEKAATKVSTGVASSGVWSAKGLLKHADQVNLSDVQQERLVKIAADTERLSTLSKELKAAEKDLTKLMFSSEATLAEVEKQVRALEEQRVNYRLAAFRHAQEIRNVVRPEQAQALALITAPVQQGDSPNSITF